MRRCGDTAVFDELGGHIPDTISGCHRLRGRRPVDLLPDSCYSEITNLRFALSGVVNPYSVSRI